MTNNPQLSLSQNLHDLLLTFPQTTFYKKGSYVFQEGEDATILYFIKSGHIQLSKITPDGRELTFQISSTNDLIGEVTLFCGTAKHMLQARTIEDSEVVMIEKHVLEQKLVENPALSIEYMQWMGQRMQRLHTKFRDLILHGKKGALYSTLIRMSNSFGIMRENGIELNILLTNQELANLCGTSREVINRMLSDLRKRNVLSIEKGRVTIHDLNFLKTEMNCENCPTYLCQMD
ncbi:Crp/Fnr family transcriptional regulator [Bacillus sp. CGMCC 1.16541]|uniref:Crp/Fnr family transcriptional regulator n=1 Tax=Bacillus sp. CGMCC 1.16541 TaxID=2185143 RepID=UPI001950C3BA|nr:Crp/Fnr family transcriptional regulator [Bacillus sp. CGMCC 1.16541]